MIWTGAQGLVYGSSRDPLQTYKKRKASVLVSLKNLSKTFTVDGKDYLRFFSFSYNP